MGRKEFLKVLEKASEKKRFVVEKQLIQIDYEVLDTLNGNTMIERFTSNTPTCKTPIIAKKKALVFANKLNKTQSLFPIVTDDCKNANSEDRCFTCGHVHYTLTNQGHNHEIDMWYKEPPNNKKPKRLLRALESEKGKC